MLIFSIMKMHCHQWSAKRSVPFFYYYYLIFRIEDYKLLILKKKIMPYSILYPIHVFTQISL